MLLSSALAHANLKSGASSERLALVEFMAAFLDAAAHEPLARPNR